MIKFKKITQIVIFIILHINWNINNFKLAIRLNRIILGLRACTFGIEGEFPRSDRLTRTLIEELKRKKKTI